MRRDWSGSVFQTPGRKTYSAKFLVFVDGGDLDHWRVTKGHQTRVAARDALDSAKRDYRARQRGEVDDHAEHRQRPIEQHVDDFIEHVRSGLRRRPRKRPNKHVDLVRARLVRCWTEMGARTLADLSIDKAVRFLNRMIDAEGASTKTRNDYMAALKQFGRWLEEYDRIGKSPFGPLRKLDDHDHGQRQSLDAPTVGRLAAAAMQRVLQRTMPGNRVRHLDAARRRALTVLIAFLAGLRNNELANLTWRMVESDHGLIALPASVTKSGREEFVPLHDGLAAVLRAVRRERSVALRRAVADSDLVVGYIGPKGLPTLPDHIAERLREDADWIHHATVDGAGRRLDLHSLRTSFANELDRHGVPDGIIGDLMRHKPATVTRRNYVRRDAERLRPFVNQIPFEAAIVVGLLEGEPPEEPQALRDDAHGRASLSDTRGTAQ